MEKVYRHSTSTYVALFFFAFILFLLFKIFLAALESGSFVYMALTFLAFGLWAQYTYKTLRNALKRIVISTQGMAISHPMKKVSIKWDEIEECGRLRKMGLLRYYWSFYVKTDKEKDSQVEIGEQELKGIEELIKQIHKHAKGADFVSVINISPIPFIRKREVVPWDIKEIL